MEYLQKAEINVLLKASFDYGNREAHLAVQFSSFNRARANRANPPAKRRQ